VIDLELELRTSEEHVSTLCELYWARNVEGAFVHLVKDLADRFGVPAHRVPALVSEHSVARSATDRCTRCGEGRVLRSRSDLTSHASQRRYEWRCSRCQSEQREESDRAARELEANRRSLLQEVWGEYPERTPVAVEELSLTEACALLALVRVGGTEDLAHLRPRDAWTERFTPTPDFDLALLNELFAARCLDVNPASSIEAFAWDTGRPERFYLSQVSWLVPGAEHTRPLAALARQLEEVFRTGSWPQHWRGELDTLWRRVALHECLAYIETCMADHHLPLRIGDKTRLAIEETLERFSIGQTYNFIWRAAKDAAAYYMRSGIPKQQAANSVVGAIQRGAERAIASNWDVKSFGRDWRAPESTMSAVLFRSALQLADPLAERPPALPSPTG